MHPTLFQTSHPRDAKRLFKSIHTTKESEDTKCDMTSLINLKAQQCPEYKETISSNNDIIVPVICTFRVFIVGRPFPEIHGMMMMMMMMMMMIIFLDCCCIEVIWTK